jgi:nitric oxide dioxygenase
MITLATVIHGLKNPGAIVPILEEHGRRHVAYGARPEHYPMLGEAILWAIEATLEEEFNAALGEAWQAAYAMMAESMIAGAKTASGWGRVA